MNKYKVCVYAICKNEVQFVDQWVDSMNEADLIIVTDTGSDDGTVEKLRERGVIVHVNLVTPWRFDTARNISLEHVPNDIDICVCTDLDEVFEKGWRNCLEEAWTPDTKTANYLYNWSFKEDGTPDVQFNYFKAHSRHDYKWQHPIHECLKYVGASPEKKVFVTGMVLNHYPDTTKSRSTYLPLLEMAVKESPEDDRMTYYLGREYMYHDMWEKCIETLKGYLDLKSSVWKEERCASMRWIAKSYFELKNPTQAYCWYYRAIAEYPFMREPYIECAKMAYLIENWEMVFYMTKEALKIKEKSSTYINMGYCWDDTPYDLAALSCYYLGLHEESLIHAKTALSLNPNDKRLMNNIQLIENKCIH
ncbi:tetratricopeptide repeat-containing glycosyltransferase [Natranaerovirga pectinivora]|uniref:tetratricopeptide repeat-containing glycosyltransferase n=1 Tax=Natranaerovirga pectinivora TaxID=682400 RepID=UPI0010533185|nr:glycosyltransferase family 2 protein [Natranaerovirga pectinivora]